MRAWKGERYPMRSPELIESHILHGNGRKRAYVTVETSERVSWTVRRIGESGSWHEAKTVEDAKCLAEITLEDMPEIGPLEP